MISVEHLTKCYGDFKAVDDLSFEIEDGHVYGFLGPNGAGKSTTMNIMTGCLSATEGKVLIDGFDIFEEPEKAKKLIGYLPEQPPLYMSESPVEYLRFVGEAKGLRGQELKDQVQAVIAQTGLEPVMKKRIGALSKGYKQRVGIAQALLGNPKVIILDEPTVGLDPIQIIEIRELIKKLGEKHTVIFSSHILSEVQTICDQILMIAHGKLVAFDEPDQLEKQAVLPNEISLVSAASKEVTEDLLKSVEHITSMECTTTEEGFTSVKLRSDAQDIYETSRAIFLAFAEGGHILLEMALKRANLEDVFIELSRDSDGDAENSELADGETPDTAASQPGESPEEAAAETADPDETAAEEKETEVDD